MIRFLEHQEIDLKRWDEALDQMPNGLVYAKSWYLNIVCPGWCALVDGEYRSIMPLTGARKYGFRYLFPPFFTQQLGVFSMQPVTVSVVRAFMDAIPPRYRYIEMQLQADNPDPGGFEVTPRMNHLLDLGRSVEDIRKGYSESHARSLKRAAREGVHVNTSGRVSEVIRIFRQGRGKEVSALGDRQYEMFNRLTVAATARNCCDVCTATNSVGQIVAGAVFFRDARRSILIFSGASDQARQISAAHLIMDTYISNWAGKLAVLDFEGSDNHSLARFYKGFGAAESVYLKLKRNRLPVPFRWFK